MKKICYVTTVPSTLKSFVIDVAEYMHSQGKFEITFISSYDKEFEENLPEYIRYIPVKMERGVSLKGIIAVFKMYHIFRKEKFNLVQYSTPNAACYASIAAFLARIPVRLYCQWGIVYVGFSGIKRKIFKFIEKMVCTLSTNIQPDSNGNLKFSVSEKLYTSNKGEVIWNGSAKGINLDKFDITQKEKWRCQIREYYNIKQDTYVFGFAGRITRDKGINELLRAFREVQKEYNNTILLLLGTHDNVNSLDQELFSWAQENKHVILTGSVKIVEQYMSAMDVFVLPSYREGFGSSVIEAEAMGIPVIVSDIPGPTDAMEKNVTGVVVKKKDSQELALTMRKFITGKMEMDKMSKAAYKYATERFDSKKLQQHILENRKKLLGEK